MKQAQRFGYTAGDRETAQLADGYRARGDTLARTARALAGTAQEQEALTRSAEAYRQAIDLYAKVLGFAGCRANMRAVQRGLEAGRAADDRPHAKPDSTGLAAD